MRALCGRMTGRGWHMAARSDTLTPRKRLFAAAMASGQSAPDAGARLGLSLRTSWRWADDTAVKAEVMRLQGAALSAVSARLRTVAGQALDWLEAVGGDGASPAAARVSAARAVLGGGLLEYVEAQELEARIKALEDALADGEKRK